MLQAGTPDSVKTTPNQTTVTSFLPCLHDDAELIGGEVLAWRLSNTLTTDFCIEALQEAITRYGTPDIFNTDQGSQFTSADFTDVLRNHGIRISMDGKVCWRDNVFVERLWRTIKYDEVYLKAYESVSHAKTNLGAFITLYNSRRPHQAFAGRTPDMVYFAGLPQEKSAA